MADLPPRIQLRRLKGWRMPPGAVKVDRSTRWGNPFDWRAAPGSTTDAKGEAVDLFRDWILGCSAVKGAPKPPTVAEIRAALCGKPLACWCTAGEPCHADVLIEIANG